MLRRNRYEPTDPPSGLQEKAETNSTDSSDCPASPARQRPARKEKLELCKKFTELGHCPYRNRCKFAHGSHELRKNNQQNSLYKTKECAVFFREGCCHYGERCNFQHKRAGAAKKTVGERCGELLREMREESRLL